MKLYVLNEITTIGDVKRRSIGVYTSEKDAKLTAINYLSDMSRSRALELNESTLCAFKGETVCKLSIDEVDAIIQKEEEKAFYTLTKEDLLYVLDNNFTDKEKSKILKDFEINNIMEILSTSLDIDWIEAISDVIRNKCL